MYTGNCPKNLSHFFENRTKIHFKSLPEALKNNPRKRHATKTSENHKKYKKWSPKGVPGGTSNVVFGHVGAPGRPWGPTWLPDVIPGHSKPLRTSFLMILNRF